MTQVRPVAARATEAAHAEGVRITAPTARRELTRFALAPLDGVLQAARELVALIASREARGEADETLGNARRILEEAEAESGRGVAQTEGG